MGQTAEGYVFCGHELFQCRGLEYVTSQEFIFNASLLDQEDLIPLVVFSILPLRPLKYSALGANGRSEGSLSNITYNNTPIRTFFFPLKHTAVSEGNDSVV